MSDGENSDFFDDPKAYDDEQSDEFSGLSRRGSESYNQPPEVDQHLQKQDSMPKNSNMVVDLRNKFRKTTSDSSEPSHIHQEIPAPPPMVQHIQPINVSSNPQEAVETRKSIVEIGMRLKSIYPQRYFIFKNMKPQHYKFSRDFNYGITPKMNENTLKSAFENSENLLIIFSNTDQRSFLGYARMESDYFDAPDDVDSFLKNSGLSRTDFDNNFLFRIEWKSKNTLRYEFVSQIKNKYNENREVNHSKVFQEVDPIAGTALIALIEDPPTERVVEPEPEAPPSVAPNMPMNKKEDHPPPHMGAPPGMGKPAPGFPPGNFMMPPGMNPMMPNPYGFFPMGPPGGMPPHMGGGMFPMPNQPGMMGMQKGGFPFYDYYGMNMQHPQQQQMPKPKKGKKEDKKSASSSGSSSRSSSPGSSPSSGSRKSSKSKPKKESVSRSRSSSKEDYKRRNKVKERDNKGNENYKNKKYEDNKNKKFQKYDKRDNNKFDKFEGKGGYKRGGRRDSPPRNQRGGRGGRFNNYNKHGRRSTSRSEERRNTYSRDRNQDRSEEVCEKQDSIMEENSPKERRERSLSNNNEDNFLERLDDNLNDNDNGGFEEEKLQRRESSQVNEEFENIRRAYGGNREGSAPKSREGSRSRSTSKSVTESKSGTPNYGRKYQDQRKKKPQRQDEKPLVITKGGNKEDTIIIGGKDNSSKLVIDKSNTSRKHQKRRSKERRRSRSGSRSKDRNFNRKSRSREREDFRERRGDSRERRDEPRGYKQNEYVPRRDKEREKERDRERERDRDRERDNREREKESQGDRRGDSVESRGKKIDLRERLTQKGSASSGSITNRIIKKN